MEILRIVRFLERKEERRVRYEFHEEVKELNMSEDKKVGVEGLDEGDFGMMKTAADVEAKEEDVLCAGSGGLDV